MYKVMKGYHVTLQLQWMRDLMIEIFEDRNA